MTDELYNISKKDCDQFSIAFKNFYRKNMLKLKMGAREPDCPPNSIRTNESRRKIWDPDDPDQRRDKLAFGKRPKKRPKKHDN